MSPLSADAKHFAMEHMAPETGCAHSTGSFPRNVLHRIAIWKSSERPEWSTPWGWRDG